MPTKQPLTIPLSLIVGPDVAARSPIVTVRTNLDGIVTDTDSRRLHVGDGRAVVNGDVATVSLLQSDGAGTNVPSGWSYWLDISVRPTPQHGGGNGGDRVRRTLGPFVMPGAPTNIIDLVSQFDTPATSPEWRDGFRTEMDAEKAAAQSARTGAEAARDAAEALVISDLGTTDGQTRALIEAPASQTAQAMALTASERRNTPGRGRIAFEIDDAEPAHFTEILPMSLRLGVPFGTAWPTDYDRAAYIAQAYAAGWEILSHAHVHQDLRTLTEAELRADAEASVAAIAAITGRADDIAFVYPEHQRNAATDKILRDYFTRARGIEAKEMVPRGSATPWLVSAAWVEPYWDGAGGIEDDLKRLLDQIATGDGQMLAYFHYKGVGTEPHSLASIEAMIRYARDLGIQIVRPSELIGDTNAQVDSLLQDTTTFPWTLDPGWAFVTTGGGRVGQSLRFTPHASGGGPRTGVARTYTTTPHAAHAGRFTLYRASVQYTATADIAGTNEYQGLAFRFDGNFRTLDPASPEYGGTRQFGRKLGENGASEIPAGTGVEVSRILAVGPDLVSMYGWHPAMLSQPEGTVPLTLTDLRLDRIDTVTSLSFTATLAGTGGVIIRTGVYAVARYGITVTPLASTAGRVYATPGSNDEVVVKSTDAGDTTQQVRVTITPTGSYSGLAGTAL